MAEDTLTMKLNGAIALSDYAKAMRCFDGFVRALVAEEDPHARVTLDVEDLQAGSALTAVRLSTPNASTVAGTLQRYHDTSQALAHHGSLDSHSKRVRRWGQQIAELPRLRSIESVRLESMLGEAILTVPHDAQPEEAIALRYSMGALRGRVETLSSRRGLRFVLYDPLYDTPISCYLLAGQEEQMRGAWGRLVLVHGQIGRDARTWRPEVMRQIREVSILHDVDVDSYLSVRGAWKLPTDTLSPEARIRSVRDDETH